AMAEKRVALVIGNSAYTNVAKLANPRNDSTAIAAALTRLGFSVNEIDDANFNQMRQGLNDFGRRVNDADIVVVFFAGHGLEVGGENWLIPVDAKLGTVDIH